MVTSGVKREGLRRIGAVAAGAAAAAVIYSLRRTGILEGVPAVVFAVLLVLILPCSTCFSRRLLIGGAIFLGWMPLLWWVRLPVHQVDRVGITLALVSGALTWWVLWAPRVRERAGRLIPRFAPVDAMPVAVAGLATWMSWPLIASPGGERSLNALIGTGWDHVSHFAMVLTARAEGAIAPMLGQAPDGTSWALADYPQHFHATVTALTELYSGPALGDTVTEILRYGRSLALVQILTAVMLASGVAQLSKLRRRPVLAWPFGALMVAAFMFGQGSAGVWNACPNFVLACATAGLVALLATPMSGELKPLRVFALGGLVVATVHGWVLLAPLAIVSCAVALIPLRRDRWPHTRCGWVRMIGAIAVTIVASAVVVPILVGAGGVKVLAIVNDLLPSGLVKLSYLPRIGGVALAVSLAVYVRRETRDSAKKGLSLSAISATAFVMALLLGVYSYAVAGRLSYYFDKLLIGASLVCVAALVASIDLHVGAPQAPHGRMRKYVAVVASILAVVSALQVFGSGGLRARSRLVELTRYSAPATERILRAAETSESRPFGSAVYLALVPGDPPPILAHQWQRSLSLMWSVGSDVESGYPGSGVTVEQATEWTRTLLLETPDRTVIVAPEMAGAIRALLPSEMSSRVITWAAP